MGTDEDAITNIITRRTRDQMQEINEMYTQVFDRDLEEDLVDDISGDYMDIVLARLKPLPEYYAKVLYDVGSHRENSEAVADILLSSTNAELQEINEAYKRLRLNPSADLPMILTKNKQPLSHNMIHQLFEGARSESEVSKMCLLSTSNL